MCGISGFLGNSNWKDGQDLHWLLNLAETADQMDPESAARVDWSDYLAFVDEVSSHFDDFMRYSTHAAIVSDQKYRSAVERLVLCFKKARQVLEDLFKLGSRTDELEKTFEKLEDYIWQLDYELLKNIERVALLHPVSNGIGDLQSGERYLAWALEHALESLDKLEIRGRDSAGVSILLTLDGTQEVKDILDGKELDEFQKRRKIKNTGNGHVLEQVLENNSIAVRFIYKVANLVGKLGDNGAAISSYIKDDSLLWRLAGELSSVSIICHTRWASNGIINVDNCHPVDGSVIFDTNDMDVEDYRVDENTLFALNGDVDNYHGLVETSVRSRSARIDEAVSTDAKILPVLYALGGSSDFSPKTKFRDVMQRSQGSLAVVMQSPLYPDTLFLAQKGSGQSLYVGKTIDGYLVASEAYGLAARLRVSYPMTTTEVGGATVVLTGDDSNEELSGEYLADGGRFELKPEPIEIFSRDIFKQGYEYYIEKEIHEAPESVRRTIQGKYEKTDEGIRFLNTVFGNSDKLLSRLTNPDRTPIRRIYLIGMGTAAIAAMGAGDLLRRAIQGSGITVDSVKSSELVGFLQDRDMEDTLIIAVSQSGTTTDTNRVADLARENGAWIHCIVNRRNSPLVRKSDSYFYTGNGRDVEMSVASTKAYYSQVAAGKLMALWMADTLGAMEKTQIMSEIEALEILPQKIEDVLAMGETISNYAFQDGPSSRYWAVVGNGANRVAAEEIRIKLSELCYKSIPCDVTEDKKHIDLSTEPFTIVVANDLPEMVVQDTVKEVVIFKAHNGRPMVICAQGENRFDPVAEKTLKLPRIEGGLAFVLATVAGHLWGVEAAKAIDGNATIFRELRSEIAKALDYKDSDNHRAIMDLFEKGVALITSGNADSAIPANVAAKFVVCREILAKGPDASAYGHAALLEALNALNMIVEESTRTIDTIRHQAKTVTVGISRPQREISPLVLDSLRYIGFEADDLGPQDRKLLEALSPVVIGLEGCLLYEVIYEGSGDVNLDKVKIRAIKGLGSSDPSQSKYITPGPVRGTKRKALRTGRLAFTSGATGEESVLLAPLFEGPTPICTHEVLMHLLFANHASLQQKVEILESLGAKYQELEEMTQELGIVEDVGDVINEVNPRDLVFCSVKEIIENYKSMKG